MQMLMIAQRISASSPTDNAFDPLNKSARAQLFSSNRQLANGSGTGSYANARSVRALSGLCYISATIPNTSSGEVLAFGVTDATEDWKDSGKFAGDTAFSAGVWAPNGTAYWNGGAVDGTGGTGDAQIAVNVATRQVWIRRQGSAWAGGGDPVAGTSPTGTLAGTGAIFAIGTIDSSIASSTRVQIAHNAAATTGTVPSGFTAANWVP